MRAAVPLTLLAVTGCAGTAPLTGDRMCEEVGFAIASRIHTCTADAGLASEGYERLYAEHTCLVADVEDLGEAQLSYSVFGCPDAMMQAPCEEVVDAGADPAWWLSLSEDCAALFEAAP